MRVALIALGILIASTSAHAKTWADQGCATALVSAEDGTFALKRDGARDLVCRIGSWPISQAEAQMTCEDGSAKTLVVKDDTEIVFDGVAMFVPSDANGVCD